MADPATRPHWLLALVGAGSVAIATAGLFVGANPTLSGGFLFLGCALLVISVFEGRMEGKQEISPTKLAFNLARFKNAAKAADEQAKSGKLASVDEVVGRKK